MQYSKIKVISAFFFASVLSFILASIFHTQFVLNDLVAIGVEIDFSTRVTTTLKDIVGLAPGYGSIILVGLFLGFSIIGLLRKYFQLPRYLSYGIGGGLAFATMHLAMYPVLYITLIAGARSELGLLLQCVAGVIGGLVFAHLLLWSRGRSIFREPK